MRSLTDGWGREIKSVRVSVTDKCNFRCRYCMPAEGLEWLGRDELLTFEELSRVVSVLARMGVEEVRLTGGEPLARRDLPVLVSMLSGIPGVTDLSLTTNGVLLDRFARPLVDAGLRRLNVSLDSLSHVRFAEITRRDALDRVLAGLDAADQDQLRRDPRLHRGGGAGARRVRPPQAVRRPVHRVHASRRRGALGR